MHFTLSSSCMYDWSLIQWFLFSRLCTYHCNKEINENQWKVHFSRFMKLIHLWYHSPYTPFLWMFKQMGVSLPLDCMPLSANANLKLSGLNELTHCRKSALSMYTIKSIKCSQQDLTPQSSKKLLNRLLHQNYMTVHSNTIAVSLWTTYTCLCGQWQEVFTCKNGCFLHKVLGTDHPVRRGHHQRFLSPSIYLQGVGDHRVLGWFRGSGCFGISVINNWFTVWIQILINW